MIRQTLLILLAMLFVASALDAQQGEFKKEWNVGASFGATLSQADFSDSRPQAPFKTKLWQQYSGGLAIRYLSEKNLGLIMEMNYSQQGWQQKFEDASGNEIFDYEHTHQLNYLEVPFLTHIYFGNKVRFFINLGPKFGFLLSEKETFNDALLKHLSSGNITDERIATVAQYFKKADRKFDYGILVGMGLEFRTGIGSFSLEGRYNFGLSDFYSNKKSDHFQRSANRVIGIKATYYIKLF